MEAPLDTAVSIAKTPDGFAIGPLYIFVFMQLFSLQVDRTSQRWLLQSIYNVLNTVILIDLRKFTRNETYKALLLRWEVHMKRPAIARYQLFSAISEKLASHPLRSSTLEGLVECPLCISHLVMDPLDHSSQQACHFSTCSPSSGQRMKTK